MTPASRMALASACLPDGFDNDEGTEEGRDEPAPSWENLHCLDFVCVCGGGVSGGNLISMRCFGHCVIKARI